MLALFLTTFLSFLVWIIPDSRSPWKALYLVYVILFLAVLGHLDPQEEPALPLFAHAAVLSLVMLVGEWLFSSNDVLTFFAVFLVVLWSLGMGKQHGRSLSAVGFHMFVLMLVFMALGVAIFPFYDGVWEPAVAGSIAGSITFYSAVPHSLYF